MMSVIEPNVKLRSVHELQGLQFFIPSYQRGYRWGKTQIEDLLSDIWEYYQQATQTGTQVAGEFYCLQPLVVRHRSKDNVWEVIDGQQRLTTIYLIMKCLSTQLSALEVTSFTISFETRKRTNNQFLETLDSKLRNENVDLYHMANAVDTIQAWFEQKKVHKYAWLQTLVIDNHTGKNTKFIWYEIPENENPIDAFTRLNIGKISLTNAELVRALFLSNPKIHTEQDNIVQLRIAENWDFVEQQLQRSDFWYFIHDGENIPSNRIEFLFEQLTDSYIQECQGLGIPIPAWNSNQNRIFNYYYELFSSDNAHESSAKKAELWRSVREMYMTVDEWYNDRTLYHLVGVLLYLGKQVYEFRSASQTMVKSDFRQHLRGLIFEEIFKTKLPATDQYNFIKNTIDIKIDTISYSNSTKHQLRAILLLFNIATLLMNEDSNLRFPFDSFKTQKWDIEHIKAVANKPGRIETQREWFKSIVFFHNNNALFQTELKSENNKFKLQQSQHIQNLDIEKPGFGLLPPPDQQSTIQEQKQIHEQAIVTYINGISDFTAVFDELYPIVMSIFQEAESAQQINDIGNLTLLDQSTNRSYQNDPYPLKRAKILDVDLEGIYVPLCTRNVFLKAYSTNLDNMLIWSDDDRQNYEARIKETLITFFTRSK